ncbi:hypothetical protein OSB04_un001591 [Centaurea solstitialis]|uniref:Uncharacterized protein n=1 Tax=Centaurea solstitialis TaxID=347529 RepID=A0AA38S1V3_9ASTR|nr:hypothetical protein OSB04_un001591 [Centaurea solstitialis]
MKTLSWVGQALLFWFIVSLGYIWFHPGERNWRSSFPQPHIINGLPDDTKECGEQGSGTNVSFMINSDPFCKVRYSGSSTKDQIWTRLTRGIRSIRRHKDPPYDDHLMAIEKNQIRWFYFLTCSYGTRIEKIENFSHSQPLMKDSSEKKKNKKKKKKKKTNGFLVLYIREEGIQIKKEEGSSFF